MENASLFFSGGVSEEALGHRQDLGLPEYGCEMDVQ